MDFFRLVFRFLPKYKWRLTAYIFLNILCSTCGVFSFMAIIPLLHILFGISQDTLTYSDPGAASSYADFLAIAKDNILYYLQEQIATKGKVWVLYAVAGFVAIMSFLFNFISYFAYWVRIPIRTGISRDLRQEAYDKIVNMPVSGFANENRGDFVSRMTSDIEEVDYGLGTTLDMFIKDPIQIIVYVIAMVGLSTTLTFYSLSLLLMLCLFILFLGKMMEKISLEAQANRGRILSAYEQTLGSLSIIKSYNSGRILSCKFWALNLLSQKVFNKQNRFYSLAWPSTNFSIVAMVVILLCVGGRLILINEYRMDAATFMGFLCVLYSLTTPVNDMMKCTFGIRKAMASLTRLNRILRIQDEYEGTDNETITCNASEPLIAFKDVSFKYGSNNVLHGITFNITEGQRVSIMGMTGSGKTTLANIMSTILSNFDGEVFFGGKSIDKYRLSSLRERIAYVPQDPVLLQDTILFNITLGHQDIPLERVIEAAKKVRIHDYIMSLPEQYNTIVGDRGTTLSGGQRQCIALARAFLKDSLLYILDEASSAMDTRLEEDVTSAFLEETQGKTVIIVTHNVSLTKCSDLVLLMDKGKIVESGSPQSLLQREGLYSSLAQMQNYTHKDT